MTGDRYCWTTDPDIGVPGYYRHNPDGTIDGTVRYKWVDDTPDDPDDELGHFEPHEKQYALVTPEAVAEETPPVEQPVGLAVEAHAAIDVTPPPLEPDPEPEHGGLFSKLRGKP